MSARVALRLLALGLVLVLVAAPAGAHAAKAGRATVGSVVAVGGSKNLTSAGARLGKGARLTLGQQLTMGRNLTATLRLVKPKGVGEKDLVDLRPAKGARFTVRLSRKGSVITVRIAPS